MMSLKTSLLCLLPVLKLVAAEPVTAAIDALGCPILTEDADFFGCGVATWTTDHVQMFLRE